MIYLIIACLFSAILYRAGGMSKEITTNPKWIPMWMRNTKARDVVCSLVFVALSMVLFGVSKNWWCYVIAFGISFGMLTTYWKDKEGNPNYFLHGLGCGLAGLPLIWVGVPWFIVGSRLVLCPLIMGIWSLIVANDVAEEMGRGVAYII